MGTGCDTILAQMAAECLECKPEEVVVFGVDTDISPYDCGSYASSTTYVTGHVSPFVRKSVNAEQSISDVSRKM